MSVGGGRWEGGGGWEGQMLECEFEMAKNPNHCWKLSVQAREGFITVLQGGPTKSTHTLAFEGLWWK